MKLLSKAARLSLVSGTLLSERGILLLVSSNSTLSCETLSCCAASLETEAVSYPGSPGYIQELESYSVGDSIITSPWESQSDGVSHSEPSHIPGVEGFIGVI